jgi:hypothetical protein
MAFRLTEPKIRLSEAEVIEDCNKILRRRGWWLRRNPVGKFLTLSGNPVFFGPDGIPDYTAVHARYPAFFLEFKRPGKVLREDQQTKFAEIQLGYRLAAVMVDSVDQLVDFLRGHEARAP